MNEEYHEGLNLFYEAVDTITNEVTGLQYTVVCAPFIHLHALAELSRNYAKIFVGAQNCQQADSGAYTGEISAKMIRSTGAEYVILGHSKRRMYFGETNKLIAQKINTELKNLLKPILCIGETKAERKANQHFNVLQYQLKEGVFHLNKKQFALLVIAYEPIWVIGTGVTTTAVQAQEIHEFIRKQICIKYSPDIADATTILYGGNYSPQNVAELFSKADIDGALIGGASLIAHDFVDIVKIFN